MTKNKLENKWPLWRISAILELTFLKSKLDNHQSAIGNTEWNIHFNWYFKASKCYCESKIAHVQNKVFSLTEETKLLRKEKMASKTSCSSPSASLSQAPPLEPSCSSSLTPLSQSLPPVSSCFPLWASLSLVPSIVPSSSSSEPFLTPSSFELSRIYPFKVKPSEEDTNNSQISYVPGLRPNCKPYKEFPKVTENPHGGARGIYK